MVDMQKTSLAVKALLIENEEAILTQSWFEQIGGQGQKAPDKKINTKNQKEKIRTIPQSQDERRSR